MNKSQAEKNWTVMIYANGNNELQPEMLQAKMAAEKVGSSQDVNVVLQISQEKQALIDILRPYDLLPTFNLKWTGARRYFLTGGKSVLQKDLGKINMADPLKLYEFIKWAVTAYPAKRYMLILGGHGYQFVGAITDYSQNTPYIMGIPGMCVAINRASNELGHKIDLLVLDVCYFNFIEVMYELGKEETHAVKNVLTYIDKGPIKGLPYDRMLQAVHANSTIEDLRHFVCNLIDSLHFDLVAVEINHSKLHYIKQLYNDLARCYEECHGENCISLPTLLVAMNSAYPWYNLVLDIHYQSLSIVLGYKRISNHNAMLLHCASLPTGDSERLTLYTKLGFAQNNYWTYLLSNKTYHQHPSATGDTDLCPYPLTPEDIYCYISIMNPSLSEEHKKNILGKLYHYKKWSWPLPFQK